jgi:hypothetical protein
MYTVTPGMNTSSVKMINLRRCYKTTQTLWASPRKCFLYGTGTIASRHGCLILTDYIVMNHLGTYMQI